MEDEKSAPKVINPNPAPPPPAPFPASSSQEPPRPAPRQLFTVELRPGETTIVSWKKLTKDGNTEAVAPAQMGHPAGLHPGLESRIAPPGTGKDADELQDAPPANRYSAVIEKIERLYMGQQSSDEEELDNVPDDDEYDTEDSFIDDAELDEYFQVENSATKHNGFFVNRGKLERINEHSSSPNHAPKKRRRKEWKAQIEHDGEDLPNKLVKSGGVRMKEAARIAALVGNNLPGYSQNAGIPTGENYQEEKPLANQPSHYGAVHKRSADCYTKHGHSYSELLSKDASIYPIEVKNAKRLKSSLQPKDLKDNSNISGEAMDAIYNKQHSRKIVNDLNENVDSSTKVRQRDKNGNRELPDLNLPGSKYPLQFSMKSTPLPHKEGSSARPKGTMLERAIRDLEKVVVESRPAMEIQEVDAAFQSVKRRLPQDIKQKLAKVARLACLQQSSQGRISEELIDRLMGILGHLVQLKTLKRHMKEMVELGLSAKQQKADRFQQVKREVIEMIKTRAPIFNSKIAAQQDGSAENFQDEKEALRARYSMDEAMEDKICDLYELYVEGMDEHRGPQSRKLYVELAELWPDGTIDSYGIKSAVNRARERKKQLYMRHKDAEKIRRKRVSKALRAETTVNAQPRVLQDSSYPAFTSTDGLISNSTAGNQYLPLPASSKPSVLALHASVIDRPKVEKIKGHIIRGTDELFRSGGGLLKKKLKRKSEREMVGIHSSSSKLPLQQEEKERDKSYKTSSSQKPSLSSIGIPGCEQPT